MVRTDVFMVFDKSCLFLCFHKIHKDDVKKKNCSRPSRSPDFASVVASPGSDHLKFYADAVLSVEILFSTWTYI